MRHSLAVLVLAVVFAGCGGGVDTSTPQAACDSAASAACNKLGSCMDLGTTSVADCTTNNEQNFDCATAACPQGTTYSSSAANQCISDINAESCTTADQLQLPASCDNVCT
jgi:hypothetical protein